MRIWAVVPVKRFEDAKSRLGSVLTAAERAALSRSLFEHVLSVLTASGHVDRTVVVTPSSEIRDLAEKKGALAVSDPEGAPTLAAIVDAGLSRATHEGADAAVVLMSDLPHLTASDVEDLVRTLGPARVVVVGDRRGIHTNALGLPLPQPFPTEFGAPDSFRRHVRAAEKARADVATPVIPGIAFDVDDPENLREMG